MGGGTEIVYPVITLGEIHVAHLATATLDLDDGAGYQVICPAGSLITSGLRRAEAHDRLIWCQMCRAWADSAGIELPQTGSPTAGE